MPRRVRTKPRKEPTQERAKFTVGALLDATARVLVKEGYDAASTNRVAKAAGVNIGSLYQYFPGKDALVAALIDRHVEEISRVLGESMSATVDAPLAIAIRAMVHAHVRVHAVDPALHKALIEQIPRVDRLNPIVRFRRQLTAAVGAWLEGRRSELAVDDVDFAAFAVVHVVDALTQAAILDRPEDLKSGRLVDRVVELVLRYLAKGGALTLVREPVQA